MRLHNQVWIKGKSIVSALCWTPFRTIVMRAPPRYTFKHTQKDAYLHTELNKKRAATKISGFLFVFVVGMSVPLRKTKGLGLTLNWGCRTKH